MAIQYSPKVGEVLECDFGDFTYSEGSTIPKNTNFNGRIPPEMRKRRLVVVLNGKINSGCVVVPISSTEDSNSVQRGIHVLLPASLFKVTKFYDLRDRWAKAETMQLVSKSRLFKITDNNTRVDTYLPHDVVKDIQRSVVKAINATSLISATVLLTKEENAANINS